MKTQLLDVQGKKLKEINLPKFFESEIREDIVSKVLEAKKVRQPYAPSPVAGKQHSASGILVHRRHVWKSQYGRGISRVPRKIFSRRGTQFNWEAADIPNARGGRRAHPPKVVSMLNTNKINKKEIRIAFISALSATANEKKIVEKYGRIESAKVSLPLVVEDKFSKLKTKDVSKAIKTILGEMQQVALREKRKNSGRGKMRGRKYKTSAGMLLVLGNDEKLKTTMFDVKNVKDLSVTDLAKGGVGRLTIYTEKAIKDLEEKLK